MYSRGRMTKEQVGLEMARRYVKWHQGKDVFRMKCFALFKWKAISHLIKSGDITTNMAEKNREVWCNPTPKFWDEYCKPHQNKTSDQLDMLCGFSPMDMLSEYELVARG